MRREPTCSVVIAAYNAESTIEQAISSVIVQTRQDFELVVVDDGSTDDTAARVAPFLADRRVIFKRQPNAGPSAARNAALDLASGRYVSVLDSDDLFLPSYLESMVEALESTPAAGFAFTRMWVLERVTNRIRKRPWSPAARPIDDREEFLRALLQTNFVCGLATVRRAVIDQVGAFDPTLFASEDYDLWLRIVAHGYTAAYVPGPLCICSERPGALHRDRRRMLVGKRDAYAKALTQYHLPGELASLARTQHAAVERELTRLDDPAAVPTWLKARGLLARATRPWRERRARLPEPPPEVAAAFARLRPASRDSVQPITDATPKHGLAQVVVRGASIAGSGYVVTQAISLATYIVLARLLTPHDFGTFAAATILVGVGLVVGESGMLGALIHRRDRVEEAFDSAFVATLTGGLLLAVAGVAVAPLIGLFFHSYRTGLIAAVMAGSMMLRMAVIAPNAWLQRNFSVVRRALIDPLGTLAFAGGTVWAAAAGLGPWSLVIGTYAQLALDVVAAMILVRWRPRPGRATWSMWRELARFGRPLFGANLLSRGVDETPVAAVGRVLGSGALGQFSYAFRVAAQPISAIVDVGSYVLFPALARIAPDDERFRAGLLRALRWVCALAFPLGLLLVPLGTPAIVLVFGAKWRAAGHAVMALGVYCAALGLDTIASEVWKAAGRPGMLPRMHGLSLVLTVVFVGALVPFGLNAVTIGMALAAIGKGAYAIRGIGRVTGIPLRRLLSEVWPPAVAAVVMAAVLFVTEHGLLHSDRHGVAAGIGLLALETLLGACVYLPCLSALSANCRDELLSLVRRAPRLGRAELA